MAKEAHAVSSAVLTVSEETSCLPLFDSLLSAGSACGAEGEDGASAAIARAHHCPVNL